MLNSNVFSVFVKLLPLLGGYRICLDYTENNQLFCCGFQTDSLHCLPQEVSLKTNDLND